MWTTKVGNLLLYLGRQIGHYTQILQILKADFKRAKTLAGR